MEPTLERTTSLGDTYPLYRGVMAPVPEEGVREFIREDRRPRDSGKNIPFNICFNLMIEHRFGIPLARQRSLFVSGDVENVVRYAARHDTAHVGVVTPSEPFRFLYSPHIADSFSSPWTKELTTRYLSCFKGNQEKLCRPILDDISLTLSKLEVFFAKNPEIDLGVFTFGGLSLKQRIYRALDFDIGYTMEDLATGARVGAEILLFDCPGGYRLERIPESDLPAEPKAEFEGRWFN